MSRFLTLLLLSVLFLGAGQFTQSPVYGQDFDLRQAELAITGMT